MDDEEYIEEQEIARNWKDCRTCNSLIPIDEKYIKLELFKDEATLGYLFCSPKCLRIFAKKYLDEMNDWFSSKA